VLAAGLLAAALLLAACGNSESTGGSTTTTADEGDTTAPTDGEQVPVDAPGVTDTEIRVGGVTSTTNPLDGKYGLAYDGVRAYFEMVNSEGGVHGRDLVLVAERDDKVAGNSAEVTGLLEQDDVFAVLPVATLLFTGADQLVAAGVPTFGWTINPEWQGTPEEPRSNLFGQAGSYLCLGCEQPTIPWVAQQAGREKVALLGYAVPQSSQCVEGWDLSFEKYGEEAGAEVVFKDDSLSYGTTDFSVQVSKMKDAGVDMVVTCIDTNGVVNLAKELKKQDVDAIQYLPNAYDQELLDEFGDLFEGSYAYTSFVPLEVEDQPEGMRQYREWMERTGGTVAENSLVGWLNAALFVEGLRQAGPDFSRQKVIDAINSETDWTADGLLAGVDWTTAHTAREDVTCSATLKIEDSEFVPQTGPDGETFVCFDIPSGTLETTYR
jgi:ABC-type branched-subunit amino acid transport system substrate-binding protein